jgi:hypothetical protein
MRLQCGRPLLRPADPDVAAIHYPTRSLFKGRPYQTCSYYQLDELSNSYARGMAEFGINPGTRTVLMLKPGLDFFAVFFALFKAGAVPVLIDPGIGREALAQCLADARPEAFIGTPKAQIARSWFGWARETCQKFVTAGLRWVWVNFLKQLRAMGRQQGCGPASFSTRRYCRNPVYFGQHRHPRAWSTATGTSMPRWTCCSRPSLSNPAK